MKSIDNMSFEEIINILFAKLKAKYCNNDDILDENIKKYLESFDEQYNTYLQNKIKEIPLLRTIFKKLIDEIFELDDFQMNIIKEEVRIEKILLKNLSGKNKRFLENLQEFNNILMSEKIEQAFILGYLTAIELKEEERYKNKKLSEQN